MRELQTNLPHPCNIYKICPKSQTSRIARILHLLTSNNQFGYKNGLPTIEAIVRLEQANQEGTPRAKINLSDLSKAFDCVNHIVLRTTLCKAGLPLRTIQTVQKGHQRTTLKCKDDGVYGPPGKNNVGVRQGSAISEPRFIIYLDDMVPDQQSLNGQMQLPKRYSTQHKEEISTNQFQTYIACPTDHTEGDPHPSTEQTKHGPTMHETIERSDEVICAVDENISTEQDTVPRISKKFNELLNCNNI